MPRAVGLDLGRSSITVAAVDYTSRRARILEFARVELEPGLSDDDHARAAGHAIDKLFREHRLDRDNVLVNLDPGACQLRDITVPFKTRDQIDKIVRFEAEHHLHTASIDEVIVDYVKVGEIGEKSRLLLVAALKDGIRQRLDMLGRASIDPIDFDLDAVAAFNAASRTAVADEHANLVIVDVGAAYVRIIVVEERGLSHVRVSRLGAESLAIPPSDPRSGDPNNLINTGEAPGQPESAAAKQAYVGRLVKEVRRTLMSIRMREAPGVLLLCGEGSQLPGLASRLEDELEVPIQPLKLAEGYQHQLDPDQAQELDRSGAVAIGLALKGCGADRSGMTYRREELAFQRRFEQIRLYLLAMVMLIFLGCFVPAAYFYRLQRDRHRQYAEEFTKGNIYTEAGRQPDRGVIPEFERMLQQLSNLPQATGRSREELDSDLTRVKNAAPEARIRVVGKLLDTYLQEVDERLGKDTSIPQIESALLVMAEVFKRLQEAHVSSPAIAGMPLRILDLDISAREFRLEYWAPDVASHEVVLSKLLTMSPYYFRDDTQGKPQFVGQDKEKDGGVIRVIQARRIPEEERENR
jgi:Tfp pilus assembly PilM family ATPase